LGELFRRFSYPLTYLFFASLCVIGISEGRVSRDFGFGSRWIAAITVPLERVATFPFRETQTLWSDYMALLGVRNENDRLRTRVNELKEQTRQLEEAIVSAERYQRLADFRTRNHVRMVPANVVAQDLSPWFQSVVIDQGSAAGIGPGLPVITDSGVVGVVMGVTTAAAKVLLVIDPQSRIDGFVQRSRARGSVVGASLKDCEFEYVLRGDDLEPGDSILTSGLGAVFPKGLLIGSVQKIERKSYGLFQKARIRPAVDFRKLEEVFVILDRQPVPADSDFTLNQEGLWPEAPR